MLRYAIKLIIFFLGLFLMAFGVYLTILVQNLGLNPWDVLHIGLTKNFGLSIGIWNIIIGVLLVIITMIATRKVPSSGTFLNMIFFGLFVDFFLYLDIIPKPSTYVMEYIYLLVGIVILGLGTGMYISPRIGAGPRDGFMLLVCDRTGWSVNRVKTGIEVIVLVVGFLLGGPVFIGTLIYSVLIGPIVQFSLGFWSKFVEKLLSLKSQVVKTGIRSIEKTPVEQITAGHDCS